MKALITFGIDDAEEWLAISEPTFQRYADLHGYELLVFEDVPRDRPASWYKVSGMLQTLQDFDEVLWLDADVLVLNPDEDLAETVPGWAWQALVKHHTVDGEVPNHGVWFVRRPMTPVLEKIWGMLQYLNHPWWEQAAGCELLGYDPWQRPMQRLYDTDLYRHTFFLPLEWNSQAEDRADEPRFSHEAARQDRANMMRERLEAYHAAR